ncbi:MAG: molybdopterin molybdenumtransferase MoeA [Alphaproteobacteria bacterium]|nr:molybdopterin molybdenumtransferase MoeA [Alphaproteobacteria bacterium]
MISVEEAVERITGACRLMPPESVALPEAHGRVLASDAVSRRTQPPADVSAMDGYAVRAADTDSVPATLAVVGHAPAGGAFDGTVGPGQAARIFTGGPVPAGADAVVLQEDTQAEGDRVTVRETARAGQHVRRAGIDFAEGDTLLKAGERLTAPMLGLLAAMDRPWVDVRRRPRVAILATGNELVRPGEPVGPNQIVSSNSIAVKALVERYGGVGVDLGIARDDAASLRALAEGARGADVLVTIGGASVGDHDLVKRVLGDAGLEIDFWKIAVRPGKPLIFGRLGDALMLGLPGNPVSAMVCALLFLVPALRRMQGIEPVELPRATAVLGRDLPANRERRDFMRAALERRDGRLVATPFASQDSSVISLFATAGALVIRPPHAPAATAGDTVEILPMTEL